MELKFGIFLIVSVPCILLNSPMASCHRTLPSPPAPAVSDGPTGSLASFISEPPSSSPPTTAEGPASSPTSSWAPESSPTGSLAPESSPAPSGEGSPTPPSTPSSDGNNPFFNFGSGSGFGSMNADTVKKLCEATENPTLCTNSILPFLKGPASWASALETEINSFSSLLEQAIGKFKAASSTSKNAAESLQVCLDIYGSARDDLKQAKKAVKANDLATLAVMLSGAVTDLGTCEDSFKEAGEVMPVDDNLVSTLHKLVDNCFDISSAMHA